MAEKITRWIIFDVVVALLPLAFNALRSITKTGTCTLEAVTGKGELLLIASALCAAAIGQLLASDQPKYKVRRLLAGGATTALLMLAALYFAFADDFPKVAAAAAIQRVCYVSITMFVFGVIASVSCLVIAEAK